MEEETSEYAEQLPTRKQKGGSAGDTVIIAIDGSKQSEEAFDCE